MTGVGRMESYRIRPIGDVQWKQLNYSVRVRHDEHQSTDGQVRIWRLCFFFRVFGLFLLNEKFPLCIVT